MTKRYNITLLKDRYPTAFNSPRVSRHNLQPTLFMPFNKIKREWDGFTAVAPRLRTDLLHTVNRIPVSGGRFICSHESGLPRRYGLEDNFIITTFLQKRLESNKCRRIVGMSHFAEKCMRENQMELGFGNELKTKSMIMHPNIHIGEHEDRLIGDPATSLVLTFVGGHFARKGGCVAVRIAELAEEKSLPIHVNIISSMQVGASVWTDPTEDSFFDKVFRAMSRPNITHYKALPNATVREMLGRSHFTLLPTFADTFGFSVIEGMAEYTPAITTDICALPEFMKDDFNGIVIPLPKTDIGEWKKPDYSQRHTTSYAKYFSETTERIARNIIERLEPLIGDASTMKVFRKNARLTAETMFSTSKISPLWDDLYEDAITEDLRTPATAIGNISAPINVDEALRRAEIN